jgi:aminopeptidase YwaD
MSRHSLLTALFYLCLQFTCNSQNIPRVREHIDSLCSPQFYGRGAAFNGQRKAAVYLSQKFQSAGLKLFSSDYLQPFKYNINTFPGNLNLTINGESLKPGIDFIVTPSSPSSKGNYKIQKLDTLIFSSEKVRSKFLNASLSKRILVYNENVLKKIKLQPESIQRKFQETPCRIVLKEKKLTMGLSTTQQAVPEFELLKEKFNFKNKKVSFEIDAQLIQNYEAHNVCGYIQGLLKPDSFIVITAHYDHLGTLGEGTYFPGANDNGSGVSMLLELAHYYKENPPNYSIAFIAFGAEEAGLIGSKFFTENPLFPLSQIKFLINLDLMGTGDEGMMVVNGSIHPNEFELLSSINTQKAYLAAIKKRGKAANSDHYYFSEKGVPSFFFYTLGGIAAYHDVFDIPKTLPLTKFREVHKLIIEFADVLQE